MPIKGSNVGNGLLHRLPAAETARIEAVTERMTLTVGDLLSEAGIPIRHAIFPSAGIVSLLGVSGEGEALELALVGREGMFGVPLVTSIAHLPLRAVVQGAGEAVRIKASHLRGIVADCPVLRGRMQHYAHRLTAQIVQTAICNAFHPIEARTARWMLAMSDRMETDTIVLTQALLATMLGVLRPTVNHAARQLTARGLVHYTRGIVHVLDRPGLESAACSCYPTFAAHYRSSTRG